MSKMVQTTYGNSKEILKFNEFDGIGVTVDSADIVANELGKKIVPAGTIIGGKTKAVLENPQEPVVKKNTAEDGGKAEGVLLSDVDVTYGPAPGSMVVRGYIKLDVLPEVPVAEAKAMLNLIKFVK